MYFVVSKLTFDPDTTGHLDGKELKPLIEKIEKRFKVVASAVANDKDHGLAEIAITGLSSQEQNLAKKIDAIAEFCEEAGYGRIESEATLLESIDVLHQEDDD